MNILVLTSVYPDSENVANENVTKVVKYFAESWLGAGHDVFVVHNAHRYPMFVHRLPKSLKRKIATKINFYIPDYCDVSKKHFNISGVEGIRLPILKLRPHKKVDDRGAVKQANEIISLLGKRNFVPELIICHWVCPQIQMLSVLKGKWPKARTSLVLHGSDYIYDEDFNVKQYLPYVDVLGCRSLTEAQSVKQGLSLQKMPFVCFSGIPDSYVEGATLLDKKYSNTNPLRICFVGRLVKYKNVDLLIRALSRCVDKCCVLEIIGEGAEKNYLVNLAQELGVANRVTFHGRKSREEVLSLLKRAHVFAMISKGEVFGLTYLEAMCASCIPIGSVGEGIDGVIIDGYNGYLVSPDTEEELADVISEICRTSKDRLIELATKAFETSKQYTDSKMAEVYLKNVMEGKR